MTLLAYLSPSESSELALWAKVALSLSIGGLLGLVGGLVGLVLGNLRLSAVFFLVDSAPVAAGTNIGISGLSAMGGVWRHWRERSIERRVFLVMAPVSLVGAFIGGFFSDHVAPGVLLLIFSFVIVYGGLSTLSHARSLRRAANAPESHDPAEEAPDPTARRVLLEAGVGLVIGGLGDMVGLILGSLRLPAMLRLLRMEPRLAVGTNMAVGLVTGIAGLAGHLAGGKVDWQIILMMGGASAVGSYYGARLTGRLSVTTLLIAVGVVLLLVSGAMFWQAARQL